MEQLSFFGAIAVGMGMLTREDLQAAVEEQQQFLEAGERRRLGDVLVDRGSLTAADVEIILAMQEAFEKSDEDTLFGELAVANGLTTQEKVDQALKRQQDEGNCQLIGEIMVEMGLISVYQREALLYTQSRLRDKRISS